MAGEQDAAGSNKGAVLIEEGIKMSNDESLIKDWRRLQISDHFYYMCTKWFADGDVHKYFNPYDNPYDSFIIFNNVLNDLIARLKNHRKIYNDEAFNEVLANRA